MNTLCKFAITFFAVGFAQSVWPTDDAEGCKDHPLFNRMPGYRINTCEVKEFDAREFPANAALNAENKAVKVETIEGKQTYIVYDIYGETKTASGLQIQRNYMNAVKAAGGIVIAEYGAENSGKQLSDDTWGNGDRAAVFRNHDAASRLDSIHVVALNL